MSNSCKYIKQQKQVSTNSGETWSNVIPYEYRRGSLIEPDSPDCQEEIKITRFVTIPDAFLCDGKDKYEKQVAQYSLDNGATWQYYYPSIFQLGNLVEANADICNNKWEGYYSGDTANICSNGYTYVAGRGCVKSSSSGGGSNSCRAKTVYSSLIRQCIQIDPVKYIRASSTTSTTLTSDDINYPPYNVYVGYIGDNVTSIDSRAFAECSGLTSVTLSSSVTSIGYAAFEGCSSLSSITIPNSVTSIGMSAFKGCSGLTYLEIPNSVTSLGNYIIEGCSGLTVSIGSGITSIGSNNFSNSYGLVSASITDGITSIANSAFSGCSSLTSITIPNSVTSIGSAAFRQCFGLKSVVIPSGITSINNQTFFDCTSLTSVTIPDSVTSIGGGAFESCVRLLNVTIPSGVTSISDYVFFDCNRLTSINIPSGVTSIGNDAFYRCSGLTSVTIPSGVTSIGDYAFYLCRSLTSIIVNATTPPTLGEHSLEETNYCTIFVPCESLDDYKQANVWSNYIDRLEGIPPCDTGIRYRWQPSGTTCVGYDKYQNNIRQISYDSGTTWENVSPPQYSASTLIEANSEYCGYTPPLPSGTKFLATYSDSHTESGTCNGTIISSGEVASANCVNVRIGDCVTEIYDYAFYNYTSLSSVTIPNSVTSIRAWAFASCSSLSSIIIPDSVTSINGIAFQSCGSLTSVTIGSGVTRIKEYCFAGCGLLSITIPSGVTSIGMYAFRGCGNLSSVTCLRSTPPSLGGFAFDFTSSDLRIYVPAESVIAYKNAWSDYASIIQPLPSS